MKIGICSAGYISRYGLEKGAERMASHGYECLDYSGFVNADTDFFKLPEHDFEAELVGKRLTDKNIPDVSKYIASMTNEEFFALLNE